MKKIIALLMALVMVLSMAACGNTAYANQDVYDQFQDENRDMKPVFVYDPDFLTIDGRYAKDGLYLEEGYYMVQTVDGNMVPITVVNGHWYIG